jgi:inhibitor of cysteine peptidase
MRSRTAGSGIRWGVPLVVVVVWSMAAACGGDGDVLVLTDAETGSEIEVDSGEQFEVRLDSNPSTGYSWQISEMTTPELVVLESQTHVAADTDLVGAAGTDVFVFTAVGGAGVLRLEYIRSFDDPIVPERVAEFIVRVDDAQWPPPAGTTPSTNTAVAP